MIQSGNIVLNAKLAGPHAARTLVAPGDLTVTAVFDRSFYVANRDGKLACFLRDDMEPGPLNVNCSQWPDVLSRTLRVGDVFGFVRNGYLIAPDLTIDITRLAIWTPPPFRPVDKDKTSGGIPALRSFVRDHAPLDSLAAWRLGGGRAENAWQTAYFREAGAGLDALESWLDNAGESTPDSAVGLLLGLGPGLTPSGDDVLAGCLLTLWALDRMEAHTALARAVGGLGEQRTNRISLAHLDAAAEGMGAAPFHDCLNAVLANDEALLDTVARIGGVGHSSGWDTLCGIMCCLDRYNPL